MVGRARSARLRACVPALVGAESSSVESATRDNHRGVPRRPIPTPQHGGIGTREPRSYRRSRASARRVHGDAHQAEGARLVCPGAVRGGGGGRGEGGGLVTARHAVNRKCAPASCARKWSDLRARRRAASPKTGTSRWRRQAPSLSLTNRPLRWAPQAPEPTSAPRPRPTRPRIDHARVRPAAAAVRLASSRCGRRAWQRPMSPGGPRRRSGARRQRKVPASSTVSVSGSSATSLPSVSPSSARSLAP